MNDILEGGLYFDPYDRGDFVDQENINNDTCLGILAQKSKVRVANYNWKITFNKSFEYLTQIYNEF